MSSDEFFEWDGKYETCPAVGTYDMIRLRDGTTRKFQGEGIAWPYAWEGKKPTGDDIIGFRMFKKRTPR